MGTLLRDARLALRGMWKRKTTTALLITTLGLGLGSNIAMFSMADVLLLRPLDLPNDDRLVRLWSTSPASDMFDRTTASPADLLDWKQQSGAVFESLIALEDWDSTVRGSGVPERGRSLESRSRARRWKRSRPCRAWFRWQPPTSCPREGRTPAVRSASKGGLRLNLRSARPPTREP